MANETITATLGLDTARFTAGLDRANQGAAKFKQRVEGLLGPGLIKGAGLGALGFTLGSMFLNASQKARELREELEKAGKPVDDLTRRASVLADSWDRVKGASTGFLQNIIAAVAAGGENLGRDIVLLTRGSSALGQMYADQAESLKKQAELKEAIARGTAEAAEREKAAAEAQRIREEVAKLELKTQEALAAARFESLTTEQQIAQLMRKGQTLASEFRSAEGDAVAQAQIRNEAAEVYVKLQQLQARLADEQLTKADKLADAEKERADRAKEYAANLQKIAQAQGQIAGIVSAAQRDIARVGQPSSSSAIRSIDDVIAAGRGGGPGGRAQVTDGAINIGRYVGELTRTQFREAQRIADEELRAVRAENRGNDRQAAAIRERNAARAERDFPGVQRANDAERARIAEDAKAQVAELRNAVTELKAINTKLEQG